MSRPTPEQKTHEMQISMMDFLESYNTNMPKSFPRVSVALLKKFRETHAALFTHGDLWSLDRHRKKLVDWMPRNQEV